MTPNLPPSSVDCGGNGGTRTYEIGVMRTRSRIPEDVGEPWFAQLEDLVSTFRSCPSPPLWWIVMSRLRNEPRTQANAQRRTAEGMSTREMVRCLKHYVAREV
jgi:hypothetical protein